MGKKKIRLALNFQLPRGVFSHIVRPCHPTFLAEIYIAAACSRPRGSIEMVFAAPVLAMSDCTQFARS